MKKLLIVTAALMTAALFFTGCKNAANSDGDSLPGTWNSTVTFYEDYNANGWTLHQNQITYTCNDPSSLNIATNRVRVLGCPIHNSTVYGVNVKLKQASFTNAQYGITLFESGSSDDNTDAYYRLTLFKNSYILYEKLSGQNETCLSQNDNYVNIFNNAIKQEGSENDVLFYTDGDKLVVKINGSEITRVAKKLDAGKCYAQVRIPSNATGAINVNYKFTNFQTAK